MSDHLASVSVFGMKSDYRNICTGKKQVCRMEQVAEKRWLYQSVRNTPIVGWHFPKGGNQLLFGNKPKRHD